ncbi:MAG: hypothetical protein J0H67_00180 [Rhodospirillales bacterium]|nr:hypothetical protein [Rhodospirillales bacterium]
MFKFRVYLLKDDRIEWGESIDARSAQKAAARARAKWAERSCHGKSWSIEVWRDRDPVYSDRFDLTASQDLLESVAVQAFASASTAAVAHP